ncbi:hypothetical protein MKEN_00152600 [Mycena kentingensis (nom. inval.)]|nr:hypothetical protein MKEN_00152600 [Mycena kentingensis (nom. inval.)]
MASRRQPCQRHQRYPALCKFPDVNLGRHFEDRYLSSNVNITVFDENNQTVSVPVGRRFRKFKTRKWGGRSITALGVLFDFTTNAANTTVQRVEDMVLEPWFLGAIEEEPQLFLLVGHMPIYGSGWPLVFDVIRARHPTTPILIFGGHLHIRDCLQLDGRSMSLASGRYMETVGWMSVDLDEGGTDDLNFSRRYLDANRATYQFHSGKNESSFDTEQGKNITAGLYALEERFGLTYQSGVAPQDYTMTRHPYPSANSLLSLTAEEVVPTALSLNSTRAQPFILLLSSGSQRFDIYKGPFTKNDQLTASPFVNAYVYVADVPYEAAVKVLPRMNQDGPERIWGREELEEETRETRRRRVEMEVERGYQAWLASMQRVAANADSELSLGYVTVDSCPDAGDDIPHTPLPVYPIPPFIASRTPSPAPAVVDVVFDDFILPQVLKTLNKVQSARMYGAEDVREYAEVRSNEVLGVYAQVAWN